MPLRLGSLTPKTLKVGNTQVKKLMLGTQEIWSDFSYPISGSWGPTSQGNSWLLVGSHTIQQAGSFTITNSSNNVGGYSFGSSRSQIVGPWGTSTSSYSTTTATVTTTRTLAVGDVVEFRQSGYNGSTFSGTWSITKN